MVLAGMFQITHNKPQAWAQEYEMATIYYDWACSLSMLTPDNAERWKDASNRLDRARWKVCYAEGV